MWNKKYSVEMNFKLVEDVRGGVHFSCVILFLSKEIPSQYLSPLIKEKQN